MLNAEDVIKRALANYSEMQLNCKEGSGDSMDFLRQIKVVVRF